MALPEFKLHLKGYVGGWDFDSDYVDYVVSRHEGKPLHVLIDSTGGALQTALSVSAAFSRHGDVHVHYSGMNASAATIAGMGAKEITIDSNAFWLVHNSSTFVDVFRQATAADMSAIIATLQKRIEQHNTFDAVIAEMYAKRCKKTPEELAELMEQDRWMTAREALEWGFVDSVVETAEEAEAPAESVICAMKEAGIPIPELYRRPSISERIADTLNSALEACGLKKSDSPKIENSEDMEPANNPQTTPVPEAQESATPQTQAPPVQADASASAPEASGSTDVENLRKELADAKARIAELEKEPGAATNRVVDSPAGKGGILDRFASDCADARELMDAIGC